jgi:hypothetical protein
MCVDHETRFNQVNRRGIERRARRLVPQYAKCRDEGRQRPPLAAQIGTAGLRRVWQLRLDTATGGVDLTRPRMYRRHIGLGNAR